MIGNDRALCVFSNQHVFDAADVISRNSCCFVCFNQTRTVGLLRSDQWLFLIVIVITRVYIQSFAIAKNTACVAFLGADFGFEVRTGTKFIWTVRPRAGSGVVRMDPLRVLAGCRTRRLNHV